MGIEHCLLIALLVLGLHGGKEKEEVRFVFESSETRKAERVPLEFLEDTTGQSYLDIITFRDRFVLDLLLLNTQLRESKVDTNPENHYLCPRQLLENFGLRGLNTPIIAGTPPRYCPAMKQSCCLPNDIEDLETLWATKLAPKIKYVQYYFKYFVNDLLGHHAEYLEIAAIIAENHKRPFCRSAAHKLMELRFEEHFTPETDRLLNDFLDFDYKLKRGFMCLLCDYANLGDLDFHQQLHGLNRDTCRAMVDHALDFQHFARQHLYRYINTVSAVAHCQRSMVLGANFTNSEPPLDFLPVENNQDLEVCHYAKQKGYNIFANCLTFCSSYRLWRPEHPTYPPIDRLARIHQLAKDYLYPEADSLVVSAPQDIEFSGIVVSKRDRLDVFSRWEFAFSDSQGARFNHLVDMDSPEF
jgi:hypothetical protein